MDNYIKVTKDVLNQIDYENVIAIFITEGGAMGEPNAFHAVHVLFLHSVLLFLL